MIAAGHGDEFYRVAQASVEEIKAAGPEAKDWRWRMFEALDRWMSDYDPEPLRKLALATCPPEAKKAAAEKSTSTTVKVDKQPKERRAAVAVAAAAAQTEIGNWDEAATILELAGSDLDPVDHAWVEMWKAIAAAEMCQFTAARDHAVEAMKTVLLDQDDPTAAAIGAAAAAYLFRATADQDDDEGDADAPKVSHPSVDLAQLLTLNDTAASWWRAQAIGWAVREYDDYGFRAWAGRAQSDDVLASSTMQLRSVWMSAMLAGDLGAAAGTAELWSTRIVRASTTQPWQSPASGDAELVRALGALRHGGSEPALTLVGERLWRDGDIDAITAALGNARSEGWWTPRTAWAHLRLLTAAGDLLEQSHADATVAELLEMIEHPKEFSDKYHASFDPCYFGLEALATVIPAASIDCQVNALERVLTIPDIETDQLEHLRQRVHRVFAGSSDPALRAAAQTIMTTNWVSGEDRWPFLAVLRSAGSDAAADEINTELESGNLLPLQKTSDVDRLSPESLLKLIDGEAQACEALAREAATSGPSFGGGGISAARLVAANLRSPDQAHWQPLHTLLAEKRATAESKLRALRMLLTDWSLLPEDEKHQLRELYRSSGGFPAWAVLSRIEPYTGVTIAIGHKLGEVNDDEIRKHILSLLPGDPIRRLAAAQLITDTDTPIDVREVLAADPEVAIRAETAIGLLKFGAGDQRAFRALEMVLAGSGCYVAYCVAEQLASSQLTSTALTHAATDKLTSHRSARVRALAQRAAARQ